MSTFSDQMAATALSLLTQYGEAITLTKYTRGSYSPSTLANSTGTTSATSGGFGVPIDYDGTEVNEGLVKQGDVRLYVNALSLEPETNDTVSLDSRVYRIVSVRRYAINSENVLYELQLRV